MGGRLARDAATAAAAAAAPIVQAQMTSSVFTVITRQRAPVSVQADRVAAADDVIVGNCYLHVL